MTAQSIIDAIAGFPPEEHALAEWTVVSFIPLPNPVESNPAGKNHQSVGR
jgi:hypothetical protein